jgi:hypothetical protein
MAFTWKKRGKKREARRQSYLQRRFHSRSKTPVGRPCSVPCTALQQRSDATTEVIPIICDLQIISLGFLPATLPHEHQYRPLLLFSNGLELHHRVVEALEVLRGIHQKVDLSEFSRHHQMPQG